MSAVPEADTPQVPDHVIAVEPEEDRPPGQDQRFAPSLRGLRNTRCKRAVLLVACSAACVATIVFARSKTYLALPVVLAAFAAVRL